MAILSNEISFFAGSFFTLLLLSCLYALFRCISRSLTPVVCLTIYPQCGEFHLSYAAILLLLFLCPVHGVLALVEQAAQFKEIVYTKCRPAIGDAIESIRRDHVRHIGHQGLKVSTWVVKEDPILTPRQLPCHQFVLGTSKWMKGMGYAESAPGRSHTTCIR